ncbi:hypothetical protein [Streptomyces otsuchiensis]|uniref:hypothetical protein n=1 Tax=Streptomyces otsuchiensis TaxID=2681388 RepID=UPI00103184EA|nr:hypothetical protein [Streptomyces otsuchiensis]
MSAGNNGMSTPEGGDDPFGYLYRPEDGQAPAQQPQQPSYHQVRPVGERRPYGGQRSGYGYPQPQSAPPQHDPHYAAPEAQPGGGGYHSGGPPGPYQNGGEPPRRNTLLIGAIAVVTAVVLGVGAALLFSNNDAGGDDDRADDSSEVNPTPDVPDDEDEGDTDEDGADEDETGEDEEDPEDSGDLPVADFNGADITLSNGAIVGGGQLEGARSSDGSYITGLNNNNSTVSWQFDFDGTPGDYRVYVGYTVEDGDQLMSWAINDSLRGDELEFKDHRKSGAYKDNWTYTWKQVYLNEGSNLLQIGCGGDDTCDVVIDGLVVTPHADGMEPW